MWAVLFAIFVGALALFLYRWNRKEKRKSNLRVEVQKRLDVRARSISEIEAKVNEVSIALREEIASRDLKQLVIYKPDDLQHYKFFGPISGRRSSHSVEPIVSLSSFRQEADEWAKRLDTEAANSDYQRPALFGIPFSIKECICVAGYDQTKGYAQELGKIAKEDALIVQQIKHLGGVPFVLTNVPQSLLSFSCMNPIYGTTSNAFTADRTSGGSSGGEGALIGTGGSIIGIGGDVGGSIRYPCHFNGIAGIKPSHLRLSHQGVMGSIPGRPLINASDGPMTRKISDAVTFLSAVWSDDWISSKDPYVPPVRWNRERFSGTHPLRIGYYDDDGWFMPTPPLQRAVKEARSILQAAGHNLIRFEPPHVPEAFKLFIGAVTVDGGQYLLSKIDADLECDGYGGILNIYRLPVMVQRVLAAIIAPLYPRIAHVMRAMPYDTAELRSIYEQIERYRDSFIREMRSRNIEAILCPVQVVPAVAHLYPMQLISTTSYCGIFNLLDFAAGTVCVTNVTEEDERALADYPERDPWYKMVKEATKGSVGLPVGVQVAAPPYHEETVLRILQQIETSLEHAKKASVSEEVLPGRFFFTGNCST
ncbi:Fatty-acid amide hydrolase 1 [Toxocara canis]|uniref:fatty acid amide hydrolase n=1 Tax=Toxocara canis TaxID=6265 RepID=A0A0B2VV03_TOXCA|nr:Fatty-acid amide hydrolase 1 [Toxocara canis]